VPLGGNAIPTGDFFRAYDNAKRCFRAPCPTRDAATLNESTKQSINALVTTGLNLSSSVRNAVQDAFATSEGVLAAGAIVRGNDLKATQVYKRAVPESQACGGLLGAQCTGGKVCIYAEADQCGAADQMGTCTVKPQICPAVVQPVCSCDGTTYNNACEAAAHGASVASQGACVPPCFVGGCSGEVCSDREGVITTCQARPQDVCFARANCGRQANGSCGWEQTAELKACLRNPPR
jgi:Kazal-type serine protease inhibitor domain